MNQTSSCLAAIVLRDGKGGNQKHPEIQLPARQIFVDRTIHCFS